MIWRRVAAVLWTLIIVVLCTLPGENFPDVHLISADKLAHFGIFAIFAWLWLIASRSDQRPRIWRVLIAGLAFAGLTEVYQGLLPFGRDPEVLDALANSAGLLFGVWSYHFVRSGWGRPQ